MRVSSSILGLAFLAHRGLATLMMGVLGALPSFASDTLTPSGVEHFETHVRPLLVKHCYSCHSVGSKKREGGLLLDSRPGWQAGGDNGLPIVVGDAAKSRLITAVRYEDGNLQMPPDRRLPDELIRHLEHWVKIGAPDPRNEPPLATDGTHQLDPSDPVEGRSHWAFQAFQPQPTPANAAGWATSPIDSFVLEKLDSANLQPATDADRRTLARRTYFRLLGLPPTIQQLEAFVADDRPDAYPRLVDGLLSSPRFGERWGRHWLDLARYADSNGLDENFLFREAWRYRNWVLSAVNSDLPFDRFVLQQIAGDLLPYESIAERDQQRIAAGFLVVGPKVLLGVNPDKQRMEVADEQLDTVGRAILGQTIGCARCHDHKFDPIPTADYYAMAGIFSSTEVMEGRYMLGSQRRMERLVGLGENGQKLDDAYEAYWRQQPKLKKRLEQAAAALDLIKKDKSDELKKQGSDAVADLAKDLEQPKPQRIAAQQKLIAELQQRLVAPPIPPRAMIPADKRTPTDEAIRIAGQFDRLGQPVPRGFLQVFAEGSPSEPPSMPPNQSGRMELGRWLTDDQHGAGQLAARVAANRVWRHLMGRGIVRTTDNFGRTGEAPTHPELLDYLAQELIRHNWSTKQLVRQIVLSRTFQMSSAHDDRGHQVDPENRWLWRAHRRRLEPEALWDAMRMAADQLDVTPMDSTVWYLGDQATAVGANDNRRRTDFPCRSVYLPVIRNDLPELFDVLDFADPHATTGMRPETTAATQGLYLLNDDSVVSVSEGIARRIIREVPSTAVEARVDRLFLRLSGKISQGRERSAVTGYIKAMETKLRDAGDVDPVLSAWSLAAQAILASSRFQMVE